MFGGSQLDSFSGGGFMPSQSTQGSDPSRTSAKSRDNPPLLPLTVKQISQAIQSSDEKSNFVIDGVDVNNVRLVGLAFKKSERVTDVAFTIDDGTGRIECTRWVNDAVDTKEVEEVSDGMYVRVHGHLKGFQGKTQLVIFAIRPITDYNEVATHFLECIYVHHCNRKPQSGLSVSAPGQTDVPAAVSAPSSGFNSSQLSGHLSIDGLKGIEKAVMDYLEQPSSLSQEKGIHWNEIAQQLKVPLEKIKEAIASLESEGLAYSTIDECHYKSTSA
ncbi:PREDICTED: replication protein A 32 kDa subunit A-like [Nicotiana attenuata]|uniref:Replication protein a 32 kDa subunit a n=1 Tax=Nicotiana attenuata TaxID=49451 RepID=A0A1J6K0Z3_NICAT|nr:PREDICTED: replication protein A 32 kDa subunit A-like [Nicotiana attenuata]OIT23690.1 replication protein a 32 kda subunit a [Nicotiana attenuata]